MGTRTQRKPTGQLTKDRQIQSVGVKLAQCGLFPLAGLIDQMHIASGPDQAIRCFELQIAGLKLKSTRKGPAGDPAGDRLQRQGIQSRRELHGGPGQRQIGREAGELSLNHIPPEADRAVPLSDLDIQGQVPVQP